ncbi:tRNA lysidine(34) synthetase TilS [Candidatus Saccharibacteria bacterium]|nr:MAG: tRNA lysidine(34) synthetase TilS [Candidatus Saccharibacteria bacterium]
MKNLILAVSGGVDSVVMLDMLSGRRAELGLNLLVAHVDHGIREDSAVEAEFVRALAEGYQLEFVSKRFELGEGASEQLAREARYEFLFALADQHQADIAVAHHSDDVIGSIAINLIRGTGWRGLAVMNRPGLVRPLIEFSKQDLYDYAVKNRLEWVEDSTNQDKKYLRNRLRASVLALDDATKAELTDLRQKQINLAQEIATESARINTQAGDSRYFYSMIDQSVARELLYFTVYRQTQLSLTKQMADRALLAIKTAQPGTYHDLSAKVGLRFSRQGFVVDKHL